MFSNFLPHFGGILVLRVQAHKEGVYALELARVHEGPPQLISIGADKTLAIWDTQSFKVSLAARLLLAVYVGFFL